MPIDFRIGGKPLFLLRRGKHRAQNEPAQIVAVAQQSQKLVERTLDWLHRIALAGEIEQSACVTFRHCRLRAAASQKVLSNSQKAAETQKRYSELRIKLTMSGVKPGLCLERF